MPDRSKEAYGEDLARIHDAGYSRLGAAAGKVLADALRCRGFPSGQVVDLGCGSGALSETICAAGYDVLGVDLSSSLLELARRRVPAGTFVRESLFGFRIPPSVGVGAAGECLNYLFDPANSDESLSALFKRVQGALPPGGIFLFDVLTTAHPREGYRNWGQAEDWAVLVDVRVDAPQRILTRDITTFCRVGDTFRRAREVHRVRLLVAGQVGEQLRDAGFRFRNLAGYGDIRFRRGHRAFLATKNQETISSLET